VSTFGAQFVSDAMGDAEDVVVFHSVVAPFVPVKQRHKITRVYQTSEPLTPDFTAISEEFTMVIEFEVTSFGSTTLATGRHRR
jgi:hypothetical protein